MEDLCPDCPLRDILGDQAAETLDSEKISTSDPADRARVEALPYGQAVLGALSIPRPDRCHQLDGLLPKATRTTSLRRPFDSCPEVRLIAQVVPSETEE